MSFAQEYLEMMTEAHKAISTRFQTYKSITFFGRTVKFTDEKAADIIRGSVEEWEDVERVRVKHPVTQEELIFEFNSHGDCLFCTSCINDDLDPNAFIASLFRWELKNYLEPFKSWNDDVVIKDQEGLESLFEAFTENDLKYFATCYATALEAYFIDLYHEKYKELIAQYPGLPFYPNYDFGYSLEDYYESSTCW